MRRNQDRPTIVQTNMRRALISLLTLALIAAACGSGGGETVAVAPSDGTVRAASVSTAPVADLAAGFNDAGFEVLRDQPSDANTILSPLSIGHALLMIRAAADQPTGAAIDEGFALPDGIGAHDAWNAIDQSIEQSNGTSISMADEPTPIVTIADRIWPREGLELGQEWVDLMATHHGADIETIDVDAPEESRARINDWVSEQTNQLIPELLPKEFIDGNTLLVLTDAVYFKAQWKLIFLKYGTVDAPFTNIDGSQSTTTFMRELEQPAPRGLGDGWAAAELPYLGDEYSMLVIVPDDFDSFRDDLSQTTLDEIDAAITPGPYELLLPKWEAESDIDLLPWLTEMGAAPGVYPAIADGYIDGAVHAAVISVDEIGTEAAAATGLGVGESGPPEPEFTIAADRPFLYVIRHAESGMVLFVGQVTQL